MSSSGGDRITGPFMYFDIKRMRAKGRGRLLTGEGVALARLLAEVKREGFYEAVTADKVSLRPLQTGLFRYCTQVAVRQYLPPLSCTPLLSPASLPRSI